MTSPSKLVRAAIYCRVSTDDQSCDRQERDLNEYAQRCGYTVVATHKETQSGTKNNRQERSKVIELARARGCDIVLVTELTRWGRSTIDLLNTLQELNGYNVSVVAQTGVQFDLTTAQGKMIAGVLAVLSQFERDLLSERTKSGIALARSRGKKIGRQPGQKIRPNPHTRAVLKLANSGVSYRTIATDLNISKTTVQAIINNSRAN